MSKQESAYSEYDTFRMWAHIARRKGLHSDARHYERMAKDAIEQLRREERETQ